MGKLALKKPKPLLKVGGKTFLEHIFDSLPAKINEIILVIGYKGDQIKKFFGAKYKRKKIYYIVQKMLSGTGPALLLARHYFKNKERFLILYADELVYKKEIKNCLAYKFSWLSRYFDHPEQSAVISLSADKKIVNVIEKPKYPVSNLVIGGVMVVNADIFKYRPVKHKRTGEYYLTSMMNKFVKSHNVQAVPGKDNLSFSSPRDIRKFNKTLQ